MPINETKLIFNWTMYVVENKTQIGLIDEKSIIMKKKKKNSFKKILLEIKNLFVSNKASLKSLNC